MSRTYDCEGCGVEAVAPGSRGVLPRWCEECAPPTTTLGRQRDANRREARVATLRVQNERLTTENERLRQREARLVAECDRIRRSGGSDPSQLRRLALASDLLAAWVDYSTGEDASDDALADALLVALRAGRSVHARRALLAAAGGCLARALALAEERSERMTAA